VHISVYVLCTHDKIQVNQRTDGLTKTTDKPGLCRSIHRGVVVVVGWPHHVLPPGESHSVYNMCPINVIKKMLHTLLWLEKKMGQTDGQTDKQTGE